MAELHKMATRIQFRHDVSSNWDNINPILAQGEPGFEIDTAQFKIGNGINKWKELPLQLTYKPSNFGKFYRSVTDRLQERPSVLDLAPSTEAALVIIDGLSHPLGEFFTDLQTAKQFYPKALALSDETAWAMLQTGIDILGSLGGGTLFIPRGVYVLNRGLVIPKDNVIITLEGDGRLSTKLIANYNPSSLEAFISAVGIYSPGEDRPYIIAKKLALQGVNSANLVGIYMTVTSGFSTLEDLLITNFLTGIQVGLSYYTYFNNIKSINNINDGINCGTYLGGALGQGSVNLIVITACAASTNGRYGIFIGGVCRNTVISGGTVENCGAAGLKAYLCKGLSIDNVYSESSAVTQSTEAQFMFEQCEAVRYIGNVSNWRPGSKIIWLHGCVSVDINISVEQNTFLDGTAIQIDDCPGVEISGSFTKISHPISITSGRIRLKYPRIQGKDFFASVQTASDTMYWYGGDKFTPNMVGIYVLCDNVVCTVTEFISDEQIKLDPPPGTKLNLSFSWNDPDYPVVPVTMANSPSSTLVWEGIKLLELVTSDLGADVHYQFQRFDGKTEIRNGNFIVPTHLVQNDGWTFSIIESINEDTGPGLKLVRPNDKRPSSIKFYNKDVLEAAIGILYNEGNASNVIAIGPGPELDDNGPHLSNNTASFDYITGQLHVTGELASVGAVSPGSIAAKVYGSAVSPQNVITAAEGSVCVCNDGHFYHKPPGSGFNNTGWVTIV